jgi:hypothetical protein
MTEKENIVNRLTISSELMNQSNYYEVDVNKELVVTAIKGERQEEVFSRNFVPETASDVIRRLDDRERNIEEFVLIYGLGPTVSLFNELGDEICREDGRFNKNVDRALVEWYTAASKSIKYHYALGNEARK